MEEKIIRLYLFGIGSYLILYKQNENIFIRNIMLILLFIIIDIYYPQVKIIENKNIA
jgi:hypothetical protein